MRKLTAAFALSAALIGSGLAAQMPADAWRIGPIIKGRNYSVGMPATMQDGPQGPTFAFPQQGQGHVHYATLRTGPIDGARSITLRYRVDAPRGTRFVAQEDGSPGTFGLAFQRAGDNWSARGRYNTYRWYSPEAPQITPGTHTFTARLDDPRWIAVMSSNAGQSPDEFSAALANAESVSMTFGGRNGRGHGVYSTGPARFTLLDFRID